MALWKKSAPLFVSEGGCHDVLWGAPHSSGRGPDNPPGSADVTCNEQHLIGPNAEGSPATAQEMRRNKPPPWRGNGGGPVSQVDGDCISKQLASFPNIGGRWVSFSN